MKDRSIPLRLTRRGLIGTGFTAAALVAVGACAPAPAASPSAPAAPPSTAAPAAPAAVSAPTAAPTVVPSPASTIRVGMPSGLFETLYPRAAKDAGIYDEAGLNVEFVDVRGGDTVVSRGLVGGEFDVGRQGPQGALSAIAEGGTIMMVASPQNQLAMAFLGQEGLNSLVSLYGHPVASNGQGGFLESVTGAIYRSQGLDPTQLVFVNTGTSNESIAAFAAKKVDATLVNRPDIPIVERSGVQAVELSDTVRDIPDYLRVVLSVSRNAIAQQDALLRRFFVTHAAAYRWSLNHKEAVLEAAVKYQNRDRNDAAHTFDVLLQPGLMTPDLSFTEAQMTYMQNLNIAQKIQDRILPFEQVADLRYVKAVQEELGPFTFPSP